MSTNDSDNGCREAKKKIKLTTESMQESTGKEVFKNIEIESGPALGKEAKQ